MKILTHKNKTVRFEDVQIGDVFWCFCYNEISMLAMKVAQVAGFDVNAVSLENGRLLKIENATEVEIAHVHIEDD